MAFLLNSMALFQLVCLRPSLEVLYKFHRSSWHTYIGRTLHYNTLGKIQDICHRATAPAYARTHARTHNHTYTHADIHALTLARTHACRHPRTHARTHTRTQTDICASVRAWMSACVCVRVQRMAM